MKKRRIKVKPRFWAIVGVLLISVVCLCVGCKSDEIDPEMNVCEVAAVEVEDYILDIPLSCELQKELYSAAQEFGVDYYVMIALIDRETDFANIVGDGGESFGYCQVQPKWWYGLMMEIGATDLDVPKDNFRTACAIISQLTEKHHCIEGALVAYNQGYYNGNSTPYSREIIANADRYRA